MRAEEVKGLMEAYSQVYTPQELTEDQVWEEVENWVNSLQEEGYDLSDYTWEEMYESYLSEGGPGAGAAASYAAYQKKAQGAVNTALQRGGNVAVSNDGGFLSGPMRSGSARLNSAQTKAGGRTVLDYKPDTVTTRSGAKVAPVQSSASIRLGGRAFDRLTTNKGVQYLERKPGVTPTPPKPAPGTPAKPAASPAAAKPAATPPKPAATPATPAKPAATPAAKPAGSAMDQWAAANPKLAAAKAERDRTRGTSSTTNPLMKDMKSSLPAAKPAAAATATPAAPRNGFGVDARKLAAQSSVNSSFDIFDVVLGHLLDEGYAETEQAAMVMMNNMSEEWRLSILESCGIEILDEAEVMKFQKEKDAIERRKKMKGYEPPTKGPHAEKKAPTRLRSGSLPEEYVDEAQEARNDPDAYERKQTGMNNPKTGINSKAFLDFYAAQTASKKKSKKED